MSTISKKFLLLATIMFTLSITILASCSGSNVTEITNPVEAKVRVNPDAIDSGDHMDVEIEISNITVEQFAIKVRFPTGLSYVGDTSFYELNGALKDTGPTTSVSDSSTYSYLVYYTTRSNFGSSEKGSLWIVLEGVSDVASGRVEVDIDIDNLDVSNSTEFDIATPKFDAQSDANVQVGESSGSTSSSSSSSS